MASSTPGLCTSRLNNGIWYLIAAIFLFFLTSRNAERRRNNVGFNQLRNPCCVHFLRSPSDQTQILTKVSTTLEISESNLKRVRAMILLFMSRSIEMPLQFTPWNIANTSGTPFVALKDAVIYKAIGTSHARALMLQREIRDCPLSTNIPIFNQPLQNSWV